MSYNGFVLWNGRNIAAYMPIKKDRETVKNIVKIEQKLMKDLTDLQLGIKVDDAFIAETSVFLWDEKTNKEVDKPGDKVFAIIGKVEFDFLKKTGIHEKVEEFINTIMKKFYDAGWFVCNREVRMELLKAEKEKSVVVC